MADTETDVGTGTVTTDTDTGTETTDTDDGAAGTVATETDAGALAGGGIAYSSASLAYKAFNGLLPKAQIFVPKLNEIVNTGELVGKATGRNDVGALATLVKKRKASAKSAVANSGYKSKLKQAAGIVPVLTTLVTSRVQGVSITAGMAEKNYSVMEVQYNPKSISISGNRGAMLKRPQSGDAGMQQMGMASKVSRLQFNVELIFEDIDVSDAFHLENTTINAEGLVSNIESAIINTFAGGYSVKRQCDGLMSLLNYKKLKQVIFLWGDMFFHGELVNVDVRYEMFNKQGNPVLARVRLMIEQNDSEASIRYQSDVDQWNNAIDIAFGDAIIEEVANA